MGDIQEEGELMLISLSLSPISSLKLTSDGKVGKRACNLTGVKRNKFTATPPAEVVHLVNCDVLQVRI